MKTINLTEILKQNPHIDPRKVEEVIQLLAARRLAGRPRNVYGLTSRLSQQSHSLGTLKRSS